jgi:hypothetical protein
MGPWIRALRQILPDIIQMTALTGSFQYMSILIYGDYDSAWEGQPVHFSGWLLPDDPALGACAAHMKPKGGGGSPEAVKTALYHLVDKCTPESFPQGGQHCVHVLHLTDAGAHLTCNNLDAEGRQEMKLLGKRRFDWATLTRAHIQPLPVHYSCLTTAAFVPYHFLAHATGGAVHLISNIDALFDEIKAVLNGWFGLLPVELNNWSHVSTPVYPDGAVTANLISESEFKLQLRWRVSTKNITVPTLAAGVARIASRMRSDEAFIEMAIQLLDGITKTAPLVLCSNALFGKLWREFCRRRKDPRRSVLMQQLDVSKARLPQAEREQFDEWNRASYNLADEINQELNEWAMTHGVPDGRYVTFTPDLVQRPCDMLEFSRACTAADQAAVVHVLTRLVVVTHLENAIQPCTQAQKEAYATRVEDENATPALLPPNSLPMNLPLARLFSLILHLASPGTALSPRPAAILAVLASRSGCVLAAQASEYLNSIRGSWLTWDKMMSNKGDAVAVVGENFCVPFLYLLKCQAASVLTDTETATVLRLLKFAFASRVMKMEVEVEVFQEGSMDGVFPDHQMVCDPSRGCGKKRPISLINEDSLCGHCFWDVLEKVPRKDRLVREEVPAERTFMVQCAVCSAFYARDRLALVLGRSQCFVCYHKGYLAQEAVELKSKKVKTKASGKANIASMLVAERKETPATAAARASCRDRKHSPTEECTLCRLQFVTYHGLPGGKCAACTVKPCQRKPAYACTTLTVAKLFWPNESTAAPSTAASTAIRLQCVDALFCLLGVRAQGAFDCGIMVATQILTDIPTVIPDKFPELVHNNSKVCNSAAVWAQLAEAAEKQAYEHSLCAVCCDAFPPDQLMLACGRKNCTQRICNGCGEAWYGDLTPGKLLNMRHLSCPFCVKTPVSRAIHRWNKACKNLRGTAAFDPRYFYAWCIDCNHAVEYAPRECGAGGDNDAGPRLNNYVCEPCRDVRVLELERQRVAREAEIEAQMRRDMARMNIEQRNAAVRARRAAVQAERQAAVLARVACGGRLERREFQTCPECTVMVCRVSGCNHITCNCGCHFCYECGKGFDNASDCYSHLSKVHGRLFYDEDPMFDEEDEVYNQDDR